MKRSCIVRIVYVVIFLLAVNLPASAETGIPLTQDMAIENTQWTSITNANWINDLAFDNDGYLWAATSGGAVRWDTDASAYMKYTSEYGLCSNQLSAVAVAPDGTVWFASMDNGITSLKDGVFHSYTISDGLPSNIIHDIAIAADGVVWAAADWDICSFDGQSWQTYSNTMLKEKQVYAEYILCDPDGSIWFGCGHGGVFRKSGDEWTQYNDPEEISTIVYYLTHAADGSVLASLLDVPLVRYTGDKAEIISFDSENQQVISCAYIGKDGAIWLTEYYEINRVKDGQWETFDGDNTQNTNETTCILEGPDGTVWFGGFRGGLSGYKDGEWRVLQTNDWLPDNKVNKVVPTETGGLWILSATAVTYYDGVTARAYPTNWAAQDLFIAPDDSVWVILGKNGVYRFDGSQWFFLGPGDSQDGFEDNSIGAMLAQMEAVMGDDFGKAMDDIFGGGLPEIGAGSMDDAAEGDAVVTIEPTQMGPGIEANPWYSSMEMDADGQLFCVSIEGKVHRLSGGEWSVFKRQSDEVSDISISQQGVYWLSSYDGLYRSTDGRNWKLYPMIIDSAGFIYHYGSIFVTADDVCWIASLSGVGCQPANGDSFYFKYGEGIPTQNVSCVTGTKDGTIWIGTNSSGYLENGSGAGYYDGSEWHILTGSDGLASNAVRDIYADTDCVWFSTYGGISVYSPI